MSVAKGNVLYLVAGTDGQLHPVKPHRVLSAWGGNGGLLGWPVDPTQSLTLVSVVRRDLDVACAFVMRLDVRGKRISQESIAGAMRDADLVTRKPTDVLAKRAVAKHARGLPANWRTQLAVYCDCAAVHFAEILVGGPLALARQSRMSIDEVVAYLLEKN